LSAALGLALLYPEAERTAPGRRLKAAALSEAKGVSAARVSQARKVLAFSRDLALAVRDGHHAAR
jgi:hypothetical protein